MVKKISENNNIGTRAANFVRKNKGSITIFVAVVVAVVVLASL